jgi:hypothetical protein
MQRYSILVTPADPPHREYTLCTVGTNPKAIAKMVRHSNGTRKYWRVRIVDHHRNQMEEIEGDD